LGALRRQVLAQSMLRGVNAAVVGLLLAGLYHPVWTAGILMAGDYALAIAAFLLLFMWQTPPWLVVVLCALVVPPYPTLETSALL
jgi:chromate transporter